MSIHAIQEGNALGPKRKRYGRGVGSGLGGKAGRGQKGQLSRTGGKLMAVFEGGQTPFIQKIPKAKGFKNINRIEYQVVNIDDLEIHFENGDTVSIEALIEKGLISKIKQPVKLLGKGSITKKLTISLHAVSASAQALVEKAGGSLAPLRHARKVNPPRKVKTS